HSSRAGPTREVCRHRTEFTICGRVQGALSPGFVVRGQRHECEEDLRQCRNRTGRLHRFGFAMGHVSLNAPAHDSRRDDEGLEAGRKFCDVRVCSRRLPAAGEKVRRDIAEILQDDFEEFGRLVEPATRLRLPLPPVASACCTYFAFRMAWPSMSLLK